MLKYSSDLCIYVRQKMYFVAYLSKQVINCNEVGEEYTADYFKLTNSACHLTDSENNKEKNREYK